MAQLNGYTPPGRLGNPDMTLADDPRCDVRIIEGLKSMGLIGGETAFLSLPTLGPNASIDALSPAMEARHKNAMGLYAMVPTELPGDKSEPEVSITTMSCQASEGHEIKLHVFRPVGSEKKLLPGLLYIHGGGMVIYDTRNNVHDRWAKSLAARGLVCIAIDYRNAWTPNGPPNHFPVGLNDCCAAVQYIATHRGDFGITHIVLQGESGGGNLCLATAIKAKHEGWVSEIAGVWASVPYISGGYGWPHKRKLTELPSLVECDGYILESTTMADMARYYTPQKQESTDPLAWPYHASMQDMKGLPPHIISVNELDPLRDEGIAYYRRLLQAGVSASGRVNIGLLHGFEMFFRQALPDVNLCVIRDIAGFVQSLGSVGMEIP